MNHRVCSIVLVVIFVLTSIGLAMASQAVQDCLGDLHLESSLSADSGANFVVVLPLASVETPARVDISVELDPWSDSPPHWRRGSGFSGRDAPKGSALPRHLMSPEGLEAVLALSRDDSEDVN